ncbi:sterile alpha motif domain-containing protein 1 isoform X2 [Erinaceus europaeus]|uniref:Sterile alpha motif domain-containing protein 1 isoform X2 n=1 Tax=Erinaceus europaeus TaxID=9365 RepID=A0ABM3WMN7_ERIEU|nr:sterile alpha motif domain-containing protein 1 isoform X2 [Erinaceus europaeus]
MAGPPALPPPEPAAAGGGGGGAGGGGGGASSSGGASGVSASPHYQEWILDTIDSLRSRKARPDLERICRMVRRRHGPEPERTRAELEKLIQQRAVLRVSYKGSISYRNAARVQPPRRAPPPPAAPRQPRAAPPPAPPAAPPAPRPAAPPLAAPPPPPPPAPQPPAPPGGGGRLTRGRVQGPPDEDGAPRGRPPRLGAAPPAPSPAPPQPPAQPPVRGDRPGRAPPAGGGQRAARGAKRSGEEPVVEKEEEEEEEEEEEDDEDDVSEGSEVPEAAAATTAAAAAAAATTTERPLGPQLNGDRASQNTPKERPKEWSLCAPHQGQDEARGPPMGSGSRQAFSVAGLNKEGGSAYTATGPNCPSPVPLPPGKPALPGTDGTPFGCPSARKEKPTDPVEWTVMDVVEYFTEAGFPEQATAFQEQEIDGKSLLLMQRTDVLTGLSIRLGPALKIYEHHIKVLQQGHFEDDDPDGFLS